MTDEHNRMAGNCLYQAARATDYQVCHVPRCLTANPIEPLHDAQQSPVTSGDVTERARRLLDGITPGPWIYSDIIGTDHNVTVAAWDLARCTEAGERTPDEAKANATFIAAAPVLVAGLVAAIERVRALHVCTHPIRATVDDPYVYPCGECGERLPCSTLRALDGEVDQ